MTKLRQPSFCAYTNPAVSFAYRNRCVFNFLHLNHSPFQLILECCKLSYLSKHLHKNNIQLPEHFCFYVPVSLSFFLNELLFLGISLTIVNLRSTIQIPQFSVSSNFLLPLVSQPLGQRSLFLLSYLFPHLHFITFYFTVLSEVSQSVRLLTAPLKGYTTVAYQAPPSMGFSRQEYWSGLPLPSPSAFLHLSQNCCDGARPSLELSKEHSSPSAA